MTPINIHDARNCFVVFDGSSESVFVEPVLFWLFVVGNILLLVVGAVVAATVVAGVVVVGVCLVLSGLLISSYQLRKLAFNICAFSLQFSTISITILINEIF